jgi:hypothetical protein
LEGIPKFYVHVYVHVHARVAFPSEEDFVDQNDRVVEDGMADPLGKDGILWMAKNIVAYGDADPIPIPIPQCCCQKVSSDCTTLLQKTTSIASEKV